MRRFTCTGVYSGSGPPVQWLGSGYCPNGAHEDFQGGLGGERHIIILLEVGPRL